jgi:integrase
MSPARIRVRATKAGAKRYLVLYRLGGRQHHREYTAGTFTTLREARLRRDLVAGWIASGVDPRVKLAEFQDGEKTARVFRDEATAMLASRHDVAENTLRRMRQQVSRLNRTFGDTPCQRVTVQMVQEWIASELQETKASTLLVARHTLRQVLDHAGVDPNPARDKKLRWPRSDIAEPSPPPAADWLTLVERIPSKYLLPMVLIEQAALRLEEAVALEWANVDLNGSRVRLTNTKGRRIRWAQLPDWLTLILADTPPDDRRGRVFHFTGVGMRGAMTSVCTQAGMPHYHPHDLRHRRATIWHHDGVPARPLADRLGHADPTVSLRVYSSLFPPGEVNPAELAALVRSRSEEA